MKKRTKGDDDGDVEDGAFGKKWSGEREKKEGDEEEDHDNMSVGLAANLC